MSGSSPWFLDKTLLALIFVSLNLVRVSRTFSVRATAFPKVSSRAPRAMSEPSLDSNTKDFSYWRVWSAADELERMAPGFYPDVTARVVEVLREWGDAWAGHDDWASLLNKRSLRHECEEAIVAIHNHLDSASQDYVAIDACGGKGLFSILLSYLRPKHLSKVVLIEKADINWRHIEIANESCRSEQRAEIEIWSGTNLHDYDELLDRILALDMPVTMTGIHLCKMLSPSFCGLVNGLGADRCLHVCLAPCCLPRIVTSQKHARAASSTILSVHARETPEARRERVAYMQRRRDVRKKPSGGPCFLCGDPSHGLLECPRLETQSRAEQIALQRGEHAARVPCWKCGELGHYKQDCPSAITASGPPARAPPSITVDVSGVLADPKPFRRYCHLLATSLEDRKAKVLDTPLENNEKHQAGNWNSERKAIFIVA